MIIKEIFSKFKDNSRTNCTFLEFQEFSRTKIIFKDFSRSVRTLIPNTAESHTVSQDSRMHCKVQMNELLLILRHFNCISTKEWDKTRPSHLCLKSTNEDFSVGF